MTSDAQGNRPLSEDELQELVASSDAGARNPVGAVGLSLAVIAVSWSVFKSFSPHRWQTTCYRARSIITRA